MTICQELQEDKQGIIRLRCEKSHYLYVNLITELKVANFLLQDHINFTIGRQSFNLRLLEDAQSFFRQLLEYESSQAPEQQASYLREFLFVFKVHAFCMEQINCFTATH